MRRTAWEQRFDAMERWVREESGHDEEVQADELAEVLALRERILGR